MSEEGARLVTMNELKMLTVMVTLKTVQMKKLSKIS